MPEPNGPQGFIPPHGGFADLISYQKSAIIFDLTHTYCERFLRRGDRTVDQMIQAARSGKQNIVEASLASATSKETEIKLTNVARASLGELLEDYQDQLRIHEQPLWPPDSKEALYVRCLGRRSGVSFQDFREFTETRPLHVVANIAICLLHQANYLLDQQIRRLEQDFLRHGGIRERMARARRR